MSVQDPQRYLYPFDGKYNDLSLSSEDITPVWIISVPADHELLAVLLFL